MELPADAPRPPRRALHVLPVDLGRGAQHYAASLRSRLSGPDWEHRILVLFDSAESTMNADESLGVAVGPLRRAGLDPRVVVKLRRRLQRDPVDVVVAHGGEPFKYTRLATPGGTPLVYYRIGVSQVQVAGGARRAFYRMLARRADLVAGVSQETLDDAHELMGVPRNRLRLVPNGRDRDRFDAALSSGAAAGTSSRRSSDPGGGPGPIRLISVGHLNAGKRPGWFVDLIRRLRDEGVDLEATLVGDGPLMAELRDRAEAAGIAVVGQRSDVPELLAHADIFCFTSSGESEGMPGVLIEAGMAGLATVATAVAGATTVLHDGVTGFVTPIDDFEAFVQRTRQLVIDHELRTAMGLAARERCGTEFTLDASVARFQQTLNELVTS